MSITENLSSNGRASKLRLDKETKSKPPSRSKSTKAKQALLLEYWASKYVLIAVVLSSLLNAWANVDLCMSDSVFKQMASAILGAVIPILVWMLGKASGHAYRSGIPYIPYLIGAAGVALLVLSVYHCAHAIAILTGDSWHILSTLMALGIDYGLVASEVASIMAHTDDA